MIDLRTGRAAIDEQTARSLELLDAADWQTPTRLAGWVVADLASHLAWGQALQADAWRRLAAGDSTTVADAPHVPATDRVAVMAAIRSANTAFGEALGSVTDEQAATGLCAMPYGTLPASFVLLLATMEAGVHRSDLAAAAGGDDALDEVTVDAAAAVLAGALPMLGAAGSGSAPDGASIVLRAPGLELAVVRSGDGWSTGASPVDPSTTISGSPSDVVLFALGRREAASMTVDGDRSGADEFKAWFPGP